MKKIIKTVLSLLCNGLQIIRFGSIRYPYYIGKGLKVHSPKNIFLGKNVTIGRYSRLSTYKGGKNQSLIKIGDDCYIGQMFSALSGGGEDLIIKKNTLIASYVTICSENHSIDPECGKAYGAQALSGKRTTIGEYCWIGEKVIILPGVEIGDWCVIGAGSCVTSNIPSYSIAVGNPAKVIKTYSFEKHQWVKAE